ncbi:MAG: MnhB domain-containing protein [Nitrososphaerales archaeon]
MEGMTIIVKTMSRILVPFFLLLAVYITIHGHLTAGGGFPAGVVIAASVILLLLAYGLTEQEKRLALRISKSIWAFAAIMIFTIPTIGFIFSSYFFKNVGVYPRGWPTLVFSGGSLALFNIWEAIHVATAFIVAFYLLTRE